MDTANRLALDLNRSMHETIKEICAPLCNFGITSVAYGRFFKDGKRLYLSNNSKWIELYFKEELYNNFRHTIFYIPPLDTRYLLWSVAKKDKVFEAMYDTNICNGFSIYDPHDEYFDYFGFGGDRENCHIKNYCINHLKVFEDFISIFREKNSHILNSPDQSRLIIPKKLSSFIHVKKPPLLEKYKIESFKKKIGFSEH